MVFHFNEEHAATLLEISAEISDAGVGAMHMGHALGTVCRRLQSESGVAGIFRFNPARTQVEAEKTFLWGTARKPPASRRIRGLVTESVPWATLRGDRWFSLIDGQGEDCEIRPRRTIVSLESHGNIVGYTAIYRPKAAAAFTDLDEAMARVIFRSSAWITARADALMDQKSRGLPPRPQQVLELLKSGCVEKEVASRLGISVHTVHASVKVIYDYFQVSTRGELLSKWLRLPALPTQCDRLHS